jgi:hypothetical protein
MRYDGLEPLIVFLSSLGSRLSSGILRSLFTIRLDVNNPKELVMARRETESMRITVTVVARTKRKNDFHNQCQGLSLSLSLSLDSPLLLRLRGQREASHE